MAAKVPNWQGHYFKKVPKDKNFPDNYTFRLIRDYDEIVKIRDIYMKRDSEKRIMSLDTETTDLDYTKAEVVGLSFAVSNQAGFYVPLNHVTGNADKRVLDVIYEMLKASARVIFFNFGFDYRMLRNIIPHLTVKDIKYFDIALLCWMADADMCKYVSLKAAAHWYLGWDMTTFDEMLGGVPIKYKKPENVVFYAGCDALSTYLLWFRLKKHVYDRHKFVCDLDNAVIYSLILAEDGGIDMDVNVIEDLYNRASERLKTLESRIYSLAGTVFNITSNQQLALVLKQHGIDTGEVTATGGMSVKGDLLEKLAEQTNNELLKLIVEYRDISSKVSKYYGALLSEIRTKGTRLRYKYNITGTPTGRVSASGDKKNSYYAKFNIQSVKKPTVIHYRAEYVGLNEQCPVSDENILGWRFIEDPEGSIEGYSLEDNVRHAFRGRFGKVFVHYDYSGQELRLAGNVTKEPFFVEAFLNGRDLHREVAARIWGEDRAGEMRRAAKAINFGSLYGVTGYGLSKQLDCSVEEAEQNLREWWAALPVLRRWRDIKIRETVNTGTIKTYFGRPRRLHRMLLSGDEREVQKGIRRVVNTVIQGTGADLVKLALVRVTEGFLENEKYKDYVELINYIHDELNFAVTYEEPYFTEILLGIKRLMEINIPDWPIPMVVDIGIGSSWGYFFTFRYNEVEKRWEPEM